MRSQLRHAVEALAAICLAAVAAVTGAAAPAAAQNARSGADCFPNVPLTTQDGVPIRFYDDLIKGKIVAIKLIYTTCKYSVPARNGASRPGAEAARRPHGERRVLLLDLDRPRDRHAHGAEGYAKRSRAGPGWLFLTGKNEDIDMLSRKIGLYSPPNPANPDGHKPILLVGNEATGQSMRNSGMDNAGYLATTIGRSLDS